MMSVASHQLRIDCSCDYLRHTSKHTTDRRAGEERMNGDESNSGHKDQSYRLYEYVIR